MNESLVASMKLVGGDPSVDFVNTVGGRLPPTDGKGPPSRVRDDKLRAYEDLITFAGRAGLLGEGAARELARQARARPREAARVLARARAGREALHGVLSALMERRPPAPPDLEAVNVELAALRRREQLVHRAGGLRWEPTGTRERLGSVLAPVWRSAAVLLTSDAVSHLRRCGGEDCGWLFLDRSRNGTRRWCTMEDCGNVSKVRRFRRRQRRGA